VRIAAWLAAAGLLVAQGDPKKSAREYAASARLPDFELGAEYHGRTFFSDGKAYDSGDFLTVEVAIYPAKPVQVRISQFALRLNGRKELIYAQPPGLVATAFRLQPWDETRRRVVVGAGTPDGGILVGAPAPGPRFPGDRGSPQGPAPRAPKPDYEGKIDREQEPAYDEILKREGLAEIEATKPLRGYLFFPYRGKLAKLKSIDLVLLGGTEPTAIVLKKAR